MDAEALLAGLDAAQREAVTTAAAPLGILAGAGSGKTRVLTRRIAYRVTTGGADAPHVLAVTFTRRAAGELRTRLWELGVRDRVTTGTFHGIAWRLVRERAADQGRTPPTLLVDRARTVAGVLDSQRRTRVPSVSEVVGEIDWAKARGIGVERYVAEAGRHGRRPGSGLEATAERFAAYETARRRARSLDFDDVLAVCADNLGHDRAYAEAQQWRFRHLFVDEFQDVSPLQFRLLQALRAGRDDLCLVGDPNQAIYSWNGAEPDYLRRLSDHIAGSTIVRLRTNYRSSPQVLAVAESVLAPVRGSRDDRAKRAGRVRAGPGFEAAVPAGADGPVPSVHAYPDEQVEAAGIARLLAEARPPGGRWSASAVLARTHAQLGPVERGLAAAGIPARVVSQRLADSPAVRRFLREAHARPGRGGLAELADELAELLEEPVPPAVLADLAVLVREELAADPGAPRSALTVALGTTDARGAWRRDDAVDLVTFHAAKGLEWPTVVVAGVEDGFVPLAGARQGPGREEEARLFYVALTRARHQLHVTWARARHRGTDLVARTPSPWLDGVVAACAELSLAPDRAVVASLLHDARQRIAADARPEPDPVLGALESWRRRTARAARVTEAAVCGDDVLSAIARRRPRSIAELAGVPGVGPLLARRHGPAVLAALSDH